MWTGAELTGGAHQDSVSREIDILARMRGLSEQTPLPGVVADSWKRCLTDYHLSPDRVPRAEVLTHSEIRDLMQSRESLLRVAEPEVERLFLDLVDSDYMVSLASPQGVMMLFRCDYQYLSEFANSGVLPGSVWTEEKQGTNGVGTCLRLGKSVSIIGSQHYGSATQALTCITAPVLGAGGHVEGVINVTTSRVSDTRINKVVQNIVERSARRIENGHFSQMYRRDMILRLFEGADNGNIAEEARLALDESGHIIDCTSTLTRLTGLSPRDLEGARADEIFEWNTGLEQVQSDRHFSLTLRGKELGAMLNFPAQRGRSPASSIVHLKRPGSAMSNRPARPVQTEMVEDNYHADPIISQLLERGGKLLAAGLPLVITGETGTGKTSLAKIVARQAFGDDAELRFLDCAALDKSGMSEILYDSISDEKSCVILDRLDELDEGAQSVLLGVLETQSLLEKDRKFGVIAISSADLSDRVHKGELRSDLMHRLKGGAINLMPLRSHPDLPATIREMLKLEGRHLSAALTGFESESELVLENYHWPGNLRELRNCIRHALALAGGKKIGMGHLPEDIVDEIAGKDLTARSQSESSRIEAALRHNGCNVSLTARYLGISRATLYRKIHIQKTRGEI